MNKYDKYKDSGIEWLGNIPEHWEVKRLKDITNLQFSNVDKKIKENQKNVLLCNYVDVYKNDFIDNTLKFMHSTASESEIKNFLLKIGDIMFTKDSESFDDIANSAIVTENLVNVVCGYHLAHIRTRQNSIIPNYLNKLFHSVDYNYWFRINATGITRVGLGIGAIKNSLTILPTSKEQSQISNYLDAKTTAIDKKIKLLQQKIKHYKAFRKTIINETVTKGLDKKVLLKNSGIDWIGEIPKHWEVKRLKDLSKFINGFAFNSKEYLDNGIPIIRISNISNEIDFEKCRYVDFSYLTIAKDSLILKNDILVAMTGATIGKNSIYKEERKALLNQRVGIIRAKKEINNLFLFQIIKSEIFKEYIDLLCFGSAQENISKTQIENFYIQLPPKKEQQQIANYLDKKTATIDSIVKNITTQITTLKELRKTLINEVVTGKVKVSA